MEVDPRILLVIENSVAASRWRLAARFEGPLTARQFRRLADERSAAATALADEVATADQGREPPVDRRLAHDETQGGYAPRRPRTE